MNFGKQYGNRLSATLDDAVLAALAKPIKLDQVNMISSTIPKK
jgi:hypothetical protein